MTWTTVTWLDQLRRAHQEWVALDEAYRALLERYAPESGSEVRRPITPEVMSEIATLGAQRDAAAGRYLDLYTEGS